MRPFLYKAASNAQDAVAQAAADPDAHVRSPVQFLAGGTTLIDLMKLDVMRPETLVDIKRINEPRCAELKQTATAFALERWFRWRRLPSTML